jgi:hypothetical protein
VSSVHDNYDRCQAKPKLLNNIGHTQYIFHKKYTLSINLILTPHPSKHSPNPMRRNKYSQLSRKESEINIETEMDVDVDI